MAERGGAVRGLHQQPAGQQLADRGFAREAGDQREIHPRAGDRRRLRGGAGGVVERREPHQHGVAHGRGQRHVLLQRERQPVGARRQAVGLLQGRGQLLDEERVAARAVVQQPRQPRARGGARELGDALAGLRFVERLQRDLLERAVAPQVVPQPVQRVRAVQLVGAVGGDDQQRQLAQRQRERRRAARSWPRRTTAGRRAAAPRAARRRASRARSGSPPRAWPGRCSRAPRRARGGARRGGRAAARSGPGRRGRRAGTRGTPRPPGRTGSRRAWPRRGRAACAAFTQRRVGEPGLPDPGLAGHEQQAAAAGRGFVERGSAAAPVRARGRSARGRFYARLRPEASGARCGRRPP